eukprot:3268505-Prymnesium_polylepis.1
MAAVGGGPGLLVELSGVERSFAGDIFDALPVRDALLAGTRRTCVTPWRGPLGQVRLHPLLLQPHRLLH